MSFSIDRTFFLFLVFLSAGITVQYIYDHKKNLKIIRTMSILLEKIFHPDDSHYIWLGGVIGFSAEYQAASFQKIKATLRLIPRQSPLYLPFFYLRRERDILELLFYLNEMPSQEFHIVKSELISGISNLNKLMKENEIINARDFYILYEKDKESTDELKKIVSGSRGIVEHIAITRENRIFYVKLVIDYRDFASLENLVRRLKEFCSISSQNDKS